MANEKNLKRGNPETQFKSGREAVENGRKGGIASGKAKREKKTVQMILEKFLEMDVKSNKKIKEIAKSVGITGEKSVKELITAVCIINTMKKGDIEKLQVLCELLGEDNGIQELEDISEEEAEVFGDNQTEEDT
jgi:hypothetical protein